jgi:hypothetical protein
MSDIIFSLAEPERPENPLMWITRDSVIHFADDLPGDLRLWAMTRSLLDMNTGIQAIAERLKQDAPEMFTGNELIENTPQANETLQVLSDLVDAALQVDEQSGKRKKNDPVWIDLRNEIIAAKKHLGRD